MTPETIHYPREGDDNHSPLFAALEALFTWVKICGHDKQCSHELLSNLEEVITQASKVAGFPCLV